MTNAVLALEDGTVFEGRSFGVNGSTVGEVIFNTSISGYQEIISDPSYAKQIVTLTHPQIGNVGVNSDDVEADQIFASALVVKTLPKRFSNWRSTSSLSQFLIDSNTLGICDIDTRKLTRLIRTKGAQNGCVMVGDRIDRDGAIAQAREFEGLKGMDLAKVVSTKEAYAWTEGLFDLNKGSEQPSLNFDRPLEVIAFDYGIKQNILRMLVERNCQVKVVPAQTRADQLDQNIDGVFLSNGPGDPEPCTYAIETIRELMQWQIPIFGICLGHQLLGLASGARTMKMKFGHHGANHPVRNLETGEIMITSQNHGFAVDEKSLPDDLIVTHISLFDRTIQGIRHAKHPCFSFQGHPEASPGPHDCGHLFDHFIELMQTRRRSRQI